MNPDLEKLIALQAADREVERLLEEIAALPRRVAAIASKLADAQTRVEKAKAALAANQAERRRLEAEIQNYQQKVSKYREQSLEVKTNEQYRALMQEISFVEKDIRASEDRILEGMVDSESQEQALKAAEAELKQGSAEVEQEKAETRSRTAEDEKQLAQWKARRDELRAAISPDALRYYDRVARLRKTGLAEAQGQICLACRVMLRPQTYNDVRTNQQIIACDSCGRILYYEPAHEPEAAAPRSQVSEEPAAEPTAEAPATQ